MGICGSNMRLSDPGEAVAPPDELKESAAQVWCRRHEDCVGSCCACNVVFTIFQRAIVTLFDHAGSQADHVGER